MEDRIERPQRWPPAALWRALTAAAALVLCACGCASARTAPRGTGAPARSYYVSPAGSDTAPGTTALHPWRTLARAGRAHLRPGDRVLLARGATFTGTLRVIVSGHGSASRPVVVSSYGSGSPATIEAGAGSAVAILDSGGVRVEQLVLRGAGATTNTGSGVLAVNDLPGARRLRGLTITGVQASGFGFAGIAVYGRPHDGSQSGYDDVAISDCRASANRIYGVYVYGVEDAAARTYANADVSVRDCTAFGNEGDPNYPQTHSGDGIFIGDVDGGVIDGSIAYDNGTLNSCEGCGPAGIWTADANNVRIEHSESFDNHSGPGGNDGDGFDLDGGTTNCVLQYDTSHDNDGTGLMIFGYSGAPHTVSGNTIRFDVSTDDGRRGGYPGILLSGDGQAVTHSAVYDNTVTISPPPGGSPSAIEVQGSVAATVSANVLATSGGLPLVRVPSPQPGLSFSGNDYWAGGEPLQILYGGRSYATLAAWSAASGQESSGGSQSGTTIDPAQALVGAAGRGVSG